MAFSYQFDNKTRPSIYRNLSVVAGTGPVVKATPGQIFWYFMSNKNAAVVYIKLYDKATGATAADTPIMTLAMPPGAAANQWVDCSIPFANGISIRASTAVADADADAAPAANDVVVNFLFV